MLVQLVCLDRRYQRMNCYNIREIQTILKSKYSPNTAESADIKFGLEETILGLRYQLSGIESIDPSFLLFYKNALLINFKSNSIHSFLNKPIIEFSETKLFMNQATSLFQAISNINTEYFLPTDTSTNLSFLELNSINYANNHVYNPLTNFLFPSTKLDKTPFNLKDNEVNSHRPL